MKAKCIDKVKDENNQVVSYTLQIAVTPEVLKHAIKSNIIEVTNITLTSDNRLIDTVLKPQTKSDEQKLEEQKLEYIVDNAINIPGYKMEKMSTYCGHECTLISKDENNHTIYIPDDVVKLTFTRHIKKLQGHIKVIGGHNLKDTANMFFRCYAQYIDLSSFDTSNVTNMQGMFRWCKAKSIDLSSFNTSNVTNMSSMFSGCAVQSLDLSSFNTSNVTNMSSMFFDCQVQSLDLSNFDTSNVTNMESMFGECKAQSLDLSSFNTSNVTNMKDMFLGCQAQSLDLSNFDTSNVKDMSCMFFGCKAQLTATDPKILEEYNKSR